MQSKQQRLPRFTRDPDAAGSFQFTKRDLELLRQIAEHRFIRSERLVKLVGGSKQQVLRRLNLLYHHGYLDRPHAQLDYYQEGGSRSMVYGLASRGAGRLRRDLNMPFHCMDWTTRNKRVGRLFIEHTLMVSDFMVKLELDCRQRIDVRLLYPNELPKPNGTKNNREPFRWIVDLPCMRQVGVVPDKVFALEVSQPDGVTKLTHYFLEADRGTMPVERRDLRLSCVLRKLRAYEATHSTQVYRTRLRADRFRVLFSCPKAIRVEHVRKAIAKLDKARRLFRVISNDELEASGNCLDLLSDSWREESAATPRS